MKNRFLVFLRKYWLSLSLSVLMVIGMYLSTRYADCYEIGSDMVRFDLSTLFVFYVIPVYSFIYGCLCYVKIKKVWVPQLILYLITSIYLFVAHLIMYKEIDAWKNILLFSLCPVVFSLIGTALTALVCYVIKSINENQN